MGLLNSVAQMDVSQKLPASGLQIRYSMARDGTSGPIGEYINVKFGKCPRFLPASLGFSVYLG